MVYWIGDINKNTVLNLTESCKWTRKTIANIYIGRYLAVSMQILIRVQNITYNVINKSFYAHFIHIAKLKIAVRFENK